MDCEEKGEEGRESQEQSFVKRILLGKRGGPLLEEALLIGVGVILFVVIVNIVSDLTAWLKEASKSLPTLIFFITTLEVRGVAHRNKR